MSEPTYEGLSIPEYDAREQAEKHRQAERDYSLRLKAEETRQRQVRARLTMAGYIVSGITAAAVAVGLPYVAWLAFRGPSTEDQQRQEARMSCIDKGGIWLSTEGDTDSRGNSTSGFGTCAFSIDLTP